MAQLSSSTIIYDQIILKISDFIKKYKENKFTNNKEFIEEYQNILNYLTNNISRAINWIRFIH